MTWLIAKWALARADLAKLPRWVWITAAAAALLLGGYVVHQRHAAAVIKTAVTKAVADRDTQWRAAFAKEHEAALTYRAQAEQTAAALTTARKALSDEEARRLAAHADDLRVRGPGKAAADCRPSDHPGLPASAAGTTPAAAGQDAGRPVLPSEQWATVPWTWLVGRAEGHDALLNYMLQDQAWHREQAATWEKMRNPSR